MLLSLLAVAVPVWRAVRVEPAEAIRVGHLAARGAGLLGGARWLRLPGRGYRSMPLRNLARTPRRTALTALAVAAAITTLVAVGGLLDSFRASIRDGDAELARGAPDRLMVTLDAWYPAAAPEVRQVLALPQIGTASLGLQVPMTASTTKGKVALVTEVLPAASPWRPSLRAGRPSGGQVLAEKAARDLGVAAGDRLVVRYPQPQPTGGARMVQRRLPVVGIHPNPLRVLAYTDAPTAASLGLAGVVNRLQLVPTETAGRDRLRAALFGQAAVSTVEDVGTTSRLLDDALAQFVGVLVIMGGAVLLLALLIAYNSSSVSVDERARDHATMLAFGLPVRSLLAMLTVESVTVGVLGSALGLLGGFLVLRWIVSGLLPDTLPDLGIAPVIGSTTVLVALAVGIVAMTLAPTLTLRRLRHIDIPSTLRVVE